MAKPEDIALVTSILSDRLKGVEQFGLAGNLNLSEKNYAVKTGTSQDYHDSWTVGYTPDFLVVVWFGNPDRSALKQVTGASGAGSIWHDTMETLIGSPYNHHTPLSLSKVKTIDIEGRSELGLPGEVPAEHRSLLSDTPLILSPHENDSFLKEETAVITLQAREEVAWSVDGTALASGTKSFFRPSATGVYRIQAVGRSGAREEITIRVTAPQ